jgi:hypothetical protein
MGSDASRRFAQAELRRSGSREAAAARVGPLNEAARLLSFLRATLVELDEATASFLENIREQDALEASAQRDPDRERELFEAGGRLAGVMHLRVEAFYALARQLLDALTLFVDGHAEVADRLAPSLAARAEELGAQLATDHDRHVRLDNGASTMTASVWSSTGDCGMTPGALEGSVVLTTVLSALEEHVADVVRAVEAIDAAPADAADAV